jgi:FKBP-type peptidyl-prolyl cis-trans isomerase SlyD
VVGDEAQITLEPEEAYGVVRQDLFQEIPKNQFPADTEIAPGMTFQAQGPQGPFMITVAAINDNDTVSVDLNHPLAGKRLCFDIKVVEVRQPTGGELLQLSNGSGCGCGCCDSAPEEDACGCGPKEQSNCGCGGSCG